jgi:hypothetical protein
VLQALRVRVPAISRIEGTSLNLRRGQAAGEVRPSDSGFTLKSRVSVHTTLFNLFNLLSNNITCLAAIYHFINGTSPKPLRREARQSFAGPTSNFLATQHFYLGGYACSDDAIMWGLKLVYAHLSLYFGLSGGTVPPRAVKCRYRFNKHTLACLGTASIGGSSDDTLRVGWPRDNWRGAHK